MNTKTLYKIAGLLFSMYSSGVIIIYLIRHQPNLPVYDLGNLFGALFIIIPVYLLSLLLIRFPIHSYGEKEFELKELLYDGLIGSTCVLLILLALSIAPKLDSLLQDVDVYFN